MDKKKLVTASVIALLLLGGVWWRFFLLSPQDCTSLEKYDALTGSCYYDCTTEADCMAKAQKVEAELDAFFADSQAISAPTKSKSAGPAAPPEAGVQLTLEDTGSETGGRVYTVASDQTLTPQPSVQHAELWQLFSRVASKQAITERLASFEVYENADDSSAASVWQDQHNPEKWHMNVNAAYANDKKDLVHTMVHEYGHIVSLNRNQVEQVDGACPRLEIPEGCTNEGAYLTAFEKRFWKKYGQNVPPNSGENQDNVAAFYEGKESAFVTDYAATNPIEDLAETWAHFVLRAKPTDASEKSEKVRSLYAYPELVRERDRIRANLGDELNRRNLLK